MDGAARNRDQLLDDGPMRVSAAFDGVPGDIARARELVRDFLTRLRSAHGVTVRNARSVRRSSWSAN